ncbi:cytochrome P450 [Lentzea sp. E54]|uniref:cytochrome P450 n=1 Tax=Lentzea xerophila TaxID=3435883 RepID=UPI003DA3E1E3
MRQHESRSSPSGPRGTPVIGNLREYRRDLLGFLRRCARDHGDFVPVRAFTKRGFLVFDPELVAEVFTARHHDFRKVFILTDNRLFLGNGLLTSEGGSWRHNRRLVQPSFSPARIADYSTVMIEEAVALAATWRAGGVRDVQRDMMRLTLSVVVRCLFGSSPDFDHDRAGRALDVVQTRLAERTTALVPLPDSAWTPRNLPLRRALRALDELVVGIIRERRASGALGDDMLSVLLRVDDTGVRLDDRQVRDEVMTMFFAGHETTALALSWSWYLLSQHPDALARLRTELHDELGGAPPTFEHLPRLRFAANVVKESLRLYPPIYAFGRDAVRDTTIGGHHVPSGASVLVAPWVTHHDPRLFHDPEAFLPQRWNAEFERTMPKFAYFPFGGGARMCLGRSFAMAEAVLVLATLAGSFTPEYQGDGAPALWPTFTLRARDGLPMTFRCLDRAGDEVPGP